MKFKKLRGLAGLLLAGALIFTSVPALQTPSAVMAAEAGEQFGRMLIIRRCGIMRPPR